MFTSKKMRFGGSNIRSHARLHARSRARSYARLNDRLYDYRSRDYGIIKTDNKTYRFDKSVKVSSKFFYLFFI